MLVPQVFEVFISFLLFTQAQGFKRECIQLRAELDVVQEKLRKSETLREKEGKDFQRKISDAEEYLRSELYRQERRCGDLEEVAKSEALSTRSL